MQQAGAETEQVVKVGVKLFQELGERARKLEKLEAEIALYRNMAIKLATREGVEVPDFVKDGSGGLGEEQAGQLSEWLGQLVLVEETMTTTTGRTSSRKRGRLTVPRGTSRGASRGKRGGSKEDDDAAMA